MKAGTPRDMSISQFAQQLLSGKPKQDRDGKQASTQKAKYHSSGAFDPGTGYHPHAIEKVKKEFQAHTAKLGD